MFCKCAAIGELARTYTKEALEALVEVATAGQSVRRRPCYRSIERHRCLRATNLSYLSASPVATGLLKTQVRTRPAAPREACGGRAGASADPAALALWNGGQRLAGKPVMAMPHGTLENSLQWSAAAASWRRRLSLEGVSDRAHRGADACIATAVTELDGRILRALVGVVDHASRTPHHERHVQSIEHQLRGERGGHRPTDRLHASSTTAR
jgi:hypothetical protein